MEPQATFFAPQALFGRPPKKARPLKQKPKSLGPHGTRFETMAILVKALKCVTKRLRAFP